MHTREHAPHRATREFYGRDIERQYLDEAFEASELVGSMRCKSARRQRQDTSGPTANLDRIASKSRNLRLREIEDDAFGGVEAIADLVAALAVTDGFKANDAKFHADTHQHIGVINRLSRRIGGIELRIPVKADTVYA